MFICAQHAYRVDEPLTLHLLNADVIYRADDEFDTPHYLPRNPAAMKDSIVHEVCDWRRSRAGVATDVGIVR